MFKGYFDIFNPKKIGSSFFLYVVYPRIFFVSFSTAIFGVLFIKLQGTYFSLAEIAIMSQISSLSVLLIPLLSQLKIRALLKLSILSEFIVLFIIVLYYYNFIETKMFLYCSIFSEIMLLLVYSNLISLFQSFEIRKTHSNSQKHRTRGKMLIGAIGSLIGSVFIIMCNNIVLLLLLSTLLTTIIILITNFKMIKFCVSKVSKNLSEN